MTLYITGNANIDATKYLGTNNNQPLVIKTNSTADPSEKMRVNPDGGVGIGKTPAETLVLGPRHSPGSGTWRDRRSTVAVPERATPSAIGRPRRSWMGRRLGRGGSGNPAQ